MLLINIEDNYVKLVNFNQFAFKNMYINTGSKQKTTYIFLEALFDCPKLPIPKNFFVNFKQINKAKFISVSEIISDCRKNNWFVKLKKSCYLSFFFLDTINVHILMRGKKSNLNIICTWMTSSCSVQVSTYLQIIIDLLQTVLIRITNRAQLIYP